MRFKPLAALAPLALFISASALAEQFTLTPYTSFTAHGEHITQVTLPKDGIVAEKVLLEVELGCAEIGCSDWDYTLRFDWHSEQNGQLVKLELGRLITPYAGYMQRGMHGFDRNWRRKYLFDVTHLTPVLKDQGQLVAHYGGWGAKKSAFGFAAKLISQGDKPEREVKRVINLYRSGSAGWPYKTAQDYAAYLPAQSVAFNADENHAEIKMIVSAHGHALSFNNPTGEAELCGEWCDRYFDVWQDGEKIARQPLWRDDCDQSATYPQGGTYIFSRANWCPGEKVEPFSYPININKDNAVFDIDWQSYSWEPSRWGNTAPRYIVSAQLVTYGPKQRVTDIAVRHILAPNKNLDSRLNQSCGLVEVVVKNQGQTAISAFAIDFGIVGGNRSDYQWQGQLMPGQQITLTLPSFNWGSFDADNAEFSVQAKLMGDENLANNLATSQIEAPLMLTPNTLLSLTIGSAPQDSHVEILDAQGKVVQSWQQFNADSEHQLALDLAKGCYVLNIHDAHHDGLYNPFTRSRQGKGAIALINDDKQIDLQPDFGRLLQLPFTFDYPLGQCAERPWQRGQAYSSEGEKVSYKGKVYQARHWSFDFEPDSSGPWDAWQALSYCDGSAL